MISKIKDFIINKKEIIMPKIKGFIANKKRILPFTLVVAVVLVIILIPKPAITGQDISVSLLEGTNLSQEIVDKIASQYSLNLSNFNACNEEFKNCFVDLANCLNDFDKKSQEYSICKNSWDKLINENEELKMNISKVNLYYNNLITYSNLINNSLNECTGNKENCTSELNDCTKTMEKAYNIGLKLQEQGICSNIKSSDSYEEITDCLKTVLETPNYLKIIENFSNLSKKIDLIIALIS